MTMETIKISNRLETVAGMITPGYTVADIGTDHGYLPIYIVEKKLANKVIAMDVNRGPLEKACHNIRLYQVGEGIETRLSDGLDKLVCGETDTITICGMGGKLICKILEAGKEKAEAAKELILSPQSEIKQFREYISENGFMIAEEKMVFEDGKYYFIMKCHSIEMYHLAKKSEIEKSEIEKEEIEKEEIKKEDIEKKVIEKKVIEKQVLEKEKIEEVQEIQAVQEEIFLKYGKYLLEHKDAILRRYLLKEQNKYFKVRKNIMDSESAHAEDRVQEIDYELKCIEEGLKYYEM